MIIQPKAAKAGSGKKPAPAPYSKGPKPTKAPSNPLFEKRPRHFGIGTYAACATIPLTLQARTSSRRVT